MYTHTCIHTYLFGADVLANKFAEVCTFHMRNLLGWLRIAWLKVP